MMSQQSTPLPESQVTLPESYMVTKESGVSVMNCPSCDYSSPNKHYLRQHIDLVHTTERPFKCPFCDYAGKRSHSLKEHLIVHSDERPYKCNQCNAKFRKKGHLTNHYRMHSETGQSAVECSLCTPKTFASRDELYTHLRTFHKEQRDSSVFCCNRCSYATTVKYSLHVHEMAHPDYRHVVLMTPKLPPSANVILKCSECGFETSQRKQLESHVIEKHMADRKFVHKEHPSVPRKAGPPKYKCTDCGFITSEKSQLLAHALEHTRLSAQPPSAPNESSDTVQEPEKYECSLCGYNCDTQRTLKAHMWKHSGHKNLEYPTFQNGPLSVYDGTPLAAKNFVINSSQQPCSSKIKYLADSNTTSPPALDLCESSQTSFPKVIVQNINQSDNNNTMAYARQLSGAVDVEVSTSRRSSSDQEHTNPTTGAEVKDGLDVMTAVCESMKRVENNDGEDTETALGIESDNYSATEKTAATLLSLLRQGPNINPACPPAGYEYERPDDVVAGTEASTSSGTDSTVLDGVNVAYEQVVLAESTADSMSIDSGQISDSASTVKPKTGICSSLLAVIEQLRERQADDVIKGIGDKYKRKRKRSAAFDMELSEIEVLPRDFLPAADVDIPLGAAPGVVYRCKLCHYRSSINLMKQHMKMHKNKKPHECSLCDFVATGSSSLQDHMIQHCKSRQFQCKQCSAVFNYKSQLRAHTRVHEDGQAFYCEHCEYVTSYIDSFRDHLGMHSEVITSFTCIACRQTFSDLQILQQHMKDECGEVKKLHKVNPLLDTKTTDGTKAPTPSNDQLTLTRTLKCNQCEFVALSIRSLKSHLKRHVNDKRYIQQPLEQYKCNMCGYVCHHMPSLKSHMWRHANDTDFSYSFSDILSQGNTPLDKEGKPLITLRCCQCGFETLEKHELDKHMKSHWDIIRKTFDVGTQAGSE